MQMSRLGSSLLVLAVLLAGQLLPGQQAPTFSSQVNVVNVLATVRNKHGQIVSNLTKDDFTLEEDGRPQTIGYFAPVTDLPLTLGLLVDTSWSQRRVLDEERAASKNFLLQVVRENKDKAFLIHFDQEVELLQDLTSSSQKLEAALDLLQTPEHRPDSDSDPADGTQGHGSRHGGTQMCDAIYLASNELMKKQPGRKAVIVFSDGVDRGSKETLESAIESAQRADTVVYSILFKGDQEHEGHGGFSGPEMGRGGMGGGGMGRHGGGPGGRGQRPAEESRPDGKKVLERISMETGGRFFEVTKKETTEQIYTSIQEELRSQYSLGYTPEKTGAGSGGYHKILLKTKQKDLVVQTREGYYAEP